MFSNELKLLVAAGDAVASLEVVASSIDQLSTKAARTLSVAATPFIAATLMPDICLRFRQQRRLFAGRGHDLVSSPEGLPPIPMPA